MYQNGKNRPLYVYNKTRETFLATEAAIADSYLLRLGGLLGKTKRWAQLRRGLWIVPSRCVHTIVMLFPIDLHFLGYEKKVSHSEVPTLPFLSLRAYMIQSSG